MSTDEPPTGSAADQAAHARDAALVRAFLDARARSISERPRPPADTRIEHQLVARLRPLVERAALRQFADFVRDHRRTPVVGVHDLVQTTFAKLFHDPERTLGRWDSARGPLDAYVQRIARNTMLNILRGERRRQRRISPEVDLEALLEPRDHEQVDPIGRRFVERVVMRFQVEASPAEATLFREVILEELSAAEVAERHGWTNTNSTNVWRYRLVRRLRAIADSLGRKPPSK